MAESASRLICLRHTTHIKTLGNLYVLQKCVCVCVCVSVCVCVCVSIADSFFLWHLSLGASNRLFPNLNKIQHNKAL